MKKLFTLVLAVAACCCCDVGANMTVKERLWAPAESLKQPITAALGQLPITAYGRTFQASGAKNRGIAVLPLFDWGILTAGLLGGTGDLSNFMDEQGLIGASAHVNADRVLIAMFPEVKEYLEGTIPYTTMGYAFKFGAGAGWDGTASEFATVLYVGPQFSFGK